ncbi:MAG TPA: DUF1840 domain-containing protein [Candidatus Aquabacterium excrementipullorum]|nr:DUF1840 domain-containing protein [Candidatus Aquabacterium excrementipullorum]
MSVKFKSKAAADLLMVSAHAEALLKTLGKTAAQPGILEPQDMPRALATLQGLPEEPPTPSADVDGDAADDDAPEDRVSPRTRAWPLVQMIQRSLDANEPVVWGV